MDNIMTSEQILLSSINMANLAVNMPESLKLDILQKYETLAQAKIMNNSSVVNDNMFNFQVLMNKTLFLTLVQTRKPVDLVQYTNLNNMLQLAIKDCGGNRSISAFNRLYTELAKDVTANGGTINATPSAEDVQTAIQTFGVEHANDIDDIPESDIDMSDIDIEDDSDIDMNINTDDIFDSDEPVLDDNDVANGDESVFDIDDLDDTANISDDTAITNMSDEEKEEKRKQELKEGKVSGTANDIDNSLIDAEELESLVDNTISNIMSAYAKLYQPLFHNPPKGVMFTDENGRNSIMTVGNSETKTGVRVHQLKKIRLFISPMYGAIKNISGQYLREAPKVGDDGMDIKASWMNSDGSMLYNYAPHIQVRNCMGVYKDKKTGRLNRAKTWSEFKEKLTGEFKPTITALLNRVNLNDDATVRRAMESIQELYTSIILVNEFDQEKAFRLKICCQSLSKAGLLDKLTETIINSNPLQKDLTDYQIMNNEIIGGVLQTLVVVDAAKYRGEINFAYKTLGKLLNSGGSIDLRHAIVGTDLSGNPVEVNLENNAYVSMGIVAGTRSGKGVLTMSLIASMLAAKCPVVYLDYKPDMAGTFWRLERQYGVKTLAIDGQTSKLNGLTPVRNYQAGYGIPSALRDEISDKLNVMPYIKGIQIMNLLGLARVSGKLNKSRKMFFILDEAQQCSKQIDDNRKEIETLRDKNKPKGKSEPSEEYLYLEKLSKLYSSVGQSATTFLNTNGGLGNMGALVLGQQANAQEWKGPLGALMLKCSLKFLGTGTIGGSQYGLNNKIKGVGMIGTGYFGLSTSNTPTEESTTVLKTTLVLNDADFDVNTMKGGDFSGSLLKNITNEEIKNDVINNDMIVSSKNEIAINAGYQIGEANPLVGFPGLIEFIGNNTGDFDIREVLGAGYKEVENLLNLLGIVGEDCPYKDVEGYMYSAREDSLFTSGQLTNALNNNMTIYSYLSDGINESKDGLIPEESDSEEDEKDNVINMGASSELDETDESEETLDFGDDNSSNNITNENAYDSFGSNKQEVIEVPAFNKTRNLINNDYNSDILAEYMNKYKIVQRLKYNQFDYRDRDPRKNNGIIIASIIISNYVYITTKLELQQYEIIGMCYDRINAGQDKDYRWSLLLGFIDDLKSGNLQYDEVPSEEIMRQWIKKYNPRSNRSDYIDVTDIVEPVSPNKNNTELGARIIKLSHIICKQRGWTVEKLLEFQQEALRSMGVQ